jgi:hypothetical protein
VVAAHPRLQSFFLGAVDELVAAYTKSEGAPSACKGSLRESGIRRAIEHSLPAIVRLVEGEIIDPFGRQTGQLDGIVVHATGPALATSVADSRVVLADGAVAVIESKSSLKNQWDEVLGMWGGLRKIRKSDQKAVRGMGPKPMVLSGADAVPLLAIGRQGWQKPETLCDKASELFDAFGDRSPPQVCVMQLDPPGLGWVGLGIETESPLPPSRTGRIYSREERWRPLAQIWLLLTSRAQQTEQRYVDWSGYLGEGW